MASDVRSPSTTGTVSLSRTSLPRRRRPRLNGESRNRLRRRNRPRPKGRPSPRQLQSRHPLASRLRSARQWPHRRGHCPWRQGQARLFHRPDSRQQELRPRELRACPARVNRFPVDCPKGSVRPLFRDRPSRRDRLSRHLRRAPHPERQECRRLRDCLCRRARPRLLPPDKRQVFARPRVQD